MHTRLYFKTITMFNKIFISLESKLLNISYTKDQTALERACEALSLVHQIAAQLAEAANMHSQLVKNDYHYYHQVQYRVMVYLLYFDWLVNYLEGKGDELQQCMATALPDGAYDRWKKARQEAENMREEYLKTLIRA